MGMRALFVVLLGAVAVVEPSLARANDGAFGGSGASLAPLASTPIRMVRESIELELRGRPLAWSVTAIYDFENPTGDAISVQMGYPETRCNADEGDCVGQGGRFRGLRTKVRGVAVRERIGSVSSSSPWAMELGRVHLFDVTFAPREHVSVEHRYTYDRSFTAVAGENVYYLTRTGALWNGPIGEARFTVRTPEPPLQVDHPSVFRLVSWDRKLANGRGVTELVFEARDFRAEVDFGVVLGPAGRLEMGEPLGDGSVDPTDCYLTALTSRLRPQDRARFDEWAHGAPREELVRCRNLAFALNGYTFRNAQWTRAFYGGPRRDSAMGDGWVVAPLRPATSFTQEQMATPQASFVRLVNQELARRPPTSANDD